MLINLIIIYFACGSPIGVYRITRIARSRSPRVTAIGAYFILWPIFVPAILRRSVLHNDALTGAKIERLIAGIRREMETIAFAAAFAHLIYEFREVFARYTGLTILLHCNSPSNASDALFNLGKHENTALAAACYNRRNRERLLFHQTRARRDLIALLETMARSEPGGNRIIQLGLCLGDLFNDKALFDFLTMTDNSIQPLRGKQ